MNNGKESAVQIFNELKPATNGTEVKKVLESLEQVRRVPVLLSALKKEVTKWQSLK